MIDEAITELIPLVGRVQALAAVGVSRATWYRRHRQSPQPGRPERVPTVQPRALSLVERKEIRATLESDEFVDDAPASVYAKLLDQGTYLGSVSTMYRVLHEHGEVRERRRQATHSAKKKPELIATKRNEIWSWDITKLHGPEKWTFLYLYVILDIFSRYVVGWMLGRVERAELAKRLDEPSDGGDEGCSEPAGSKHDEDNVVCVAKTTTSRRDRTRTTRQRPVDIPRSRHPIRTTHPMVEHPSLAPTLPRTQRLKPSIRIALTDDRLPGLPLF